MMYCVKCVCLLTFRQHYSVSPVIWTTISSLQYNSQQTCELYYVMCLKQLYGGGIEGGGWAVAPSNSVPPHLEEASITYAERLLKKGDS